MISAPLGAIALAVALVAIVLALALFWAAERRTARRLRRELDQERRRADVAADAATAFFDVVSHELRSPIAAIVGYQELLSDGVYGDAGAAAQEPLDRIGRSAQHLLHLVDGVVDMARLRAGTLEPQLENVDLGELLHDLVADFERRATERALPCRVVVAADLPDIRSDLQRLQRALHLMVVVGLKYPGPDGEPIELSAAPEGDGVSVRISGSRVPLVHGAADPVARTGIRIAVVSATAQLLGGELSLELDDDLPDAQVVTGLAFRVGGL